MPDPHINFHGLTDVGIVRDHNEDAFGYFLPEGHAPGDHGHTEAGGDLIAIVSDGVGGHEAGELASNATVAGVGAVLSQIACELDPSDLDQLRPRLETAMAGLNANLRSVARHRGQGKKNMAATLTAAWLAAGRLIFVHAGDSRLYRWRGGKLEQLSIDDTKAGRAIARGRITEEQARADSSWHIIERAMGIEEAKFAVTVESFEVQDGDVYLLCSDGLTSGLNNKQLEKGFSRLKDGDLETFNHKLIEAGNQASGKDNITTALIAIGQGWTAASQTNANRNFFNDAVMQSKTPKFLVPFLCALAVGLGIALYGFFRVQQSQELAMAQLQAQQGEQVAVYEARIAELDSVLMELEAELQKERESFATKMSRQWTTFEKQMEQQIESWVDATAESLNEYGEAMEATKRDFAAAIDEAQEKAASVSGQLDGVWAKFEDYREEITQLKEQFSPKPEPTPVVESAQPMEDESAEKLEP